MSSATSSTDPSSTSFLDYSSHRSEGGESTSSTNQFPHNSMTLTAKPHAFAGAVLSPKHARELTPSLCLAIASALAEQSYRKTAVPYTLWITEAWRVLGWAEPSAALFWEMASTFLSFLFVFYAFLLNSTLPSLFYETFAPFLYQF